MHFLASNKDTVANADTRDTSIKHNGNYTIKLNKDKQYGFTYHVVSFKPGDLLKISVWKYPAFQDTGRMVVSCGKDFYKFVSTGKAKDTSGWEQLEMFITVPEDNADFKIYMMNEKATNVWFDDLVIQRCPVK